MQAVQSTTDLLDVLEAVLYDGEEGAGGGGGDRAMVSTGPVYGMSGTSGALAAARQVADVLLQLAFEIMYGSSGSGGGGGGGGGGGAQVVAALLRLQSLAPVALAGREAALALLTLGAHGKELQGLHVLLHKVLQYSIAEDEPTAPRRLWRSHAAVAAAALSLQPLLAAVAFGTAPPSAPAAAWPAHLAATLQRILATGAIGGTASAATASAAAAADGDGDSEHAYGDLCLHKQCRALLLSLWASEGDPGGGGAGGAAASCGTPCSLLRWLQSLELGLRQRRRAAAAAKAAAEQLPFATRLSDVVAEAALGAADAHPALTCLVAALLVHPDPRVRVATAAAARQLVQLLPAAALPLLPLVMYQLQRGAASPVATAAAAPDAAAAQLALLQLLPVMAADPAVAPYVMRVLQPMLQHGAPEALRCLALKLLCDTWLLSGRGWPQVEAALNGLTPPGSRDPPLAVRVTRAALVRAVCDRDPGRGVELVSALQQCVCDADCPAAVALGLEALGVLVEEDVLDFYAAYKVVHRWHPGLPTDPLVASRWVALLAHGSLDAEAYPDKAAAILDILWSAARHAEGQVRAAAYSAISRYPPEVLEKLEVLRPLSQYTGPLLRETDPRVHHSVRELAAVALRFEHANRRRLLLTQPAADVQQQPADVTAAGGEAATSPNAAAAAAAPTTAATSNKGAAFAAAATAREARALRGRLLGRIPKMLLAGAGGSAGGGGAAARRTPAAGAGATGTGSFHPGAVLFCYSRPPPPPLPPGATAPAAAAAAKRAAAEAREAYSQRLRDGLRRLGWRGPWHSRLAVQAWSVFVRRWMYETGLTAAEAAAALVAEWDGTAAPVSGGAGSGASVPAAGAQQLAATAAGAPAAVLEGVGLAAGALCVAAEGLREAEVSSLASRLLHQAQSGRSSGISRSSLVGAALAATRLHPTDWAARQQVLSELRAQLLTAPTAIVRSAAATALAVLAGSLAADPAVYIRTGSAPSTTLHPASGGDSDGGGVHSRELVAVAEALSYLVSNLGALCPQLAPALAELAAAGMPPGWPQPEASYGAAPKPLKDELDEQEVLPGTAVALASLLCDVNRAHGLPAGSLARLLRALIDVAAAAAADAAGVAADGGGGRPGRGRGCSGAAAAAAALEAAAVLAPEALRYQQLAVQDLSYIFVTLRKLYGGGGSAAAVTDGRVRGAAAYCMGCVAAATMRQGMMSRELVSELALPTPAMQTSTSTSADAAPSAVAAAALGGLVSELAEVAASAIVAAGGRTDGPDTAASATAASTKGQHTAAARTGAVAGLAALLLPPPPSLVDALAPIPAGAIGSGLLSQPELLAPAKAATRTLETLAAEDSDPWVTAAAAFHLAAVAAAVAAAEGADEAAVGLEPDGPSLAGAGAAAAGGCEAAVRSGGGSGSAASAATGGSGGMAAGGGGGPKALSLYPPEGAVRPLVAVLMDRSRLSALPRSALCDTLLALAAAPALPAADWPTACRTLLAAAAASPAAAATTTAGSGGLRLQACTLLLALSHGSVPSLGLGALLEELVAPARFAALDPSIQAMLLARLPALLRSLAAKRAAAVVQSLPGLLAAAAAAPAGSSTAAGDADGSLVPWSSTAGLDEPALAELWLRRVRQALGMYGGASGATGSAAPFLALHCWMGLLGLCRSWQCKDSLLTHRDITQSAHTAIATLASQLQPLPPLQPGEAAQLLAWAATPFSAAAAAGADSASASGNDDWTSYGAAGRPLDPLSNSHDADTSEPWAMSVLSELPAVSLPRAPAGRGGGAAVRPDVTLWSLAACCMRCLRPDFLTAQVLAEAGAAEPSTASAAAGSAAAGTSLSPRALASLQLRCVLVAAGHVSYRELMPVRTAAVATAAAAAVLEADGAAATAAVTGGDPLLAVLSLALAGTPQAFQVQVLLQTLDGARASQHQHTPSRPHQHNTRASLELAAALVAACMGHAAGAAPSAAPELCLALTSRRTALDCLPYTLPRLLSRGPWSSSCEAVAQALLAVAREGLGGGSRPEAGAGEARRREEGCGRALEVVLACLWALRDALSAYTYEQVHSVLGWRALARGVRAA